MAQRPLEPGEKGKDSSVREILTAEGTWKRSDEKPAYGVKFRWRARQRVRNWDGVEKNIQAYASTQKKAEQILERKVEDFLAPSSGNLSATMRFGDLAEAWIEDRRAARDNGHIAYNSFRTYERSWYQHLREPLEHFRVDQLKRMKISSVLNTIAEEKGPGAAASARSVMVGIMKLALDNQLIQVNPAAGIELRQPEKRVVDSLSPERVKTLREFIWDKRDKVKPQVRLIMEVQLATGIRIGEACALQWKDVDFERKRIHITATMVRKDDKGLDFDTPKTLTSERTLRMTKRVYRLLRQWKEVVDQERPGDHVVFRAPKGGYADPSNSQYQQRVVMRSLYQETGDEKWLHVTTHTLRRTAATILLTAGMPINQVADFLGHGDVQTTYRSYVGRELETGNELAAQILDWEEEDTPA